MKLKAIIIDDEQSCRDILKKYIKKYNLEIELIAEADNVAIGLDLVNTISFDLLFLDIDLPDGNGFDVLEKAKTLHFNVIFTTAHNEYALKAFKYSAIDYLLKPVNIDELMVAIQKVQQKEKIGSLEKKLNLLFENYNQNKYTKINLPTKNGFEIIELDDIMYCNADNNYTHIFLRDKRKITISKTIKEYDELLPASKFYRIHQSYLVNLGYIKKYIKGDGGEVELQNGTVLDVSRRKKEGLLRHLTQ